MRPRIARVSSLAFVVVVLAVAGCASNRPLAVSAAPGAGSNPSAAAPAAPDCGDPRASLRPQGPLPSPGQMPAGSTMARIAQRGFLIAGVNRDYYPFAVRDEHLRWDGFDVDVARDIAQAIFGDRDRVRFLPLNVADRVTAAKSGDADVVVATITITCKRHLDAEFSAVYFEAHQRVLVNKGSGITGLNDLDGKRVCAGRGTTPLERIKTRVPRAIPVEVSATTDCLALLQQGEADAVSTDDALLAGMAAKDPQTELVGPGFSDEPYGVAMNHANSDLVQFVNAVLERRAHDGRWRASYQQWLVTLLGSQPAPPAPLYRDGP